MSGNSLLPCALLTLWSDFGRGGGVRPARLLSPSLYPIQALILAETLLDAVKQPVDRHTVDIPLSSTLILLT